MQRVWQSLQHWPRNIAIIIIPIIIFIAGGGFAFAYYFGGLGSSSSTTSVNLQKGLVGWWKLNDNSVTTVKDSTPYRHSGTLVNGPTPTTGRKGVVDNAYSFNGSSQYINFGNSSVFDQRAFTFNAWVKPNALGGLQEIMSKELQYKYRFSGTNLNILVGYTGSSWSCEPSYATNVTNGNWYMATITYTSSGLLTAYIDGAQVGQTTCGAITSFNTDVLNAASYRNSGSELFNGSMQDLRMYDRPLNQNEVTALYHQYNASTQVDTTAQGLVGYWPLVGNTNDTTPYRDNGTNHGATLTTNRYGAANSAYSFNGTSDYIDIPTNSALNSSTFTMAAWVDPTVLATANTIIGSGASGGPQFRIVANGKLQILEENITSIAYSTGTVPTNTWSYVAVTYDTQGNYTFYINGVASGSGTSLQPLTFSHYRIGEQVSAEYYTGAISNIRIYDRVLNQAEITTLYNSYNSHIALGGSGQSGSISLTKGLVGYWPLVGNTNDTTPYRDNGTTTLSYGPDRFGRTNASLVFPSTSGALVSLGSGSEPQLSPSTALSVNVWLELSSYGTYYAVHPVEKMSTTSDANYVLYIFGNYQSNGLQGKVGWYANAGGTWQAVSSQTKINTGQWYMITLTYTSGGGGQLYVDGQPYGGLTGSGVLASSSNPVQLNMQDGSMSDVRIYNRSLTASEVKALYALYE